MKTTRMQWTLALFAAAQIAWAEASPAAELPVAVQVELTGSNAQIGSQTLRGVQLATEENNTSGYLSPNTVKLIIDDNGSDKGQALTLLNKAALRDDALVVLGSTLSPVMAAIGPRANELKIPMTTISLSPTAIAGGPWLFKSSDVPSNIFLAMAKYTVDKIKPKNCVRVFARDNEGYVQQSQVWKDYVTNAGIKVSADLSVLSTDTDFSAIATRIVNDEPDCVHLGMPPEPAANLIIQMRQAGLPSSTKILTGVAEANNLFLKSAGRAAEGVYVLAEYRPGGANDLGRAFETAYRKKYNEAPDNYAAHGYALMEFTALAIKNAGPSPTRESVRDALSKIDVFPTIMGNGVLHMKDRSALYDTNVLVVHQGAFVPAP